MLRVFGVAKATLETATEYSTVIGIQVPATQALSTSTVEKEKKEKTGGIDTSIPADRTPTGLLSSLGNGSALPTEVSAPVQRLGRRDEGVCKNWRVSRQRGKTVP